MSLKISADYIISKNCFGHMFFFSKLHFKFQLPNLFGYIFVRENIPQFMHLAYLRDVSSISVLKEFTTLQMRRTAVVFYQSLPVESTATSEIVAFSLSGTALWSPSFLLISSPHL